MVDQPHIIFLDIILLQSFYQIQMSKMNETIHDLCTAFMILRIQTYLTNNYIPLGGHCLERLEYSQHRLPNEDLKIVTRKCSDLNFKDQKDGPE